MARPGHGEPRHGWCSPTRSACQGSSRPNPAARSGSHAPDQVKARMVMVGLNALTRRQLGSTSRLRVHAHGQVKARVVIVAHVLLAGITAQDPTLPSGSPTRLLRCWSGCSVRVKARLVMVGIDALTRLLLVRWPARFAHPPRVPGWLVACIYSPGLGLVAGTPQRLRGPAAWFHRSAQGSSGVPRHAGSTRSPSYSPF